MSTTPLTSTSFNIIKMPAEPHLGAETFHEQLEGCPLHLQEKHAATQLQATQEREG